MNYKVNFQVDEQVCVCEKCRGATLKLEYVGKWLEVVESDLAGSVGIKYIPITMAYRPCLKHESAFEIAILGKSTKEKPTNVELIPVREVFSQGRGYSGGHNTAERMGWRITPALIEEGALFWKDFSREGRFTGYTPRKLSYVPV